MTTTTTAVQTSALAAPALKHASVWISCAAEERNHAEKLRRMHAAADLNDEATLAALWHGHWVLHKEADQTEHAAIACGALLHIGVPGAIRLAEQMERELAGVRQ